MKSSNYIFFSLILITSILSCEKPERPELPDCHCGEIVETTTGDGGVNPYPTPCGAEGPTWGTDNGRALISNNCTGNIKVLCTGPVWLTVSGGLLDYPIGSQWCDPTSTNSW